MRKEVLILRSSFKNDDFVWDEYSSLIGRLTIEFNCHFTILGDEEDRNKIDHLENIDYVMIATGGVEGLFLSILDKLGSTVTLIADGRNNSLAAALECVTYLRSHNKSGRIFHDNASTIDLNRVDLPVGQLLHDSERFVPKTDLFVNCRTGVIGKPSDWLIASSVDSDVLSKGLGVEVVDVSIDKVVEIYQSTVADRAIVEQMMQCEGHGVSVDDYELSVRLYVALKQICVDNGLDALTVRCFDLVKRLSTTSCMAMAWLNDMGIVATCEGDMQTLMSMLAVRKIFDLPSFMVNPSQIGAKSATFAHCTVPLSMCAKTTLRTHFESGLGVAVEGRLQADEYTLFKWGGERLNRYFVASGRREERTYNDHLCRTQLTLGVDVANQFMTNPIGNHHILIEGDRTEDIERFMTMAGVERQMP